MRDIFDRRPEVGRFAAYAGRHGSSLYMKYGEIIEVNEGNLKVRAAWPTLRKEPRVVTLTRPTFVLLETEFVPEDHYFFVQEDEDYEDYED